MTFHEISDDLFAPPAVTKRVSTPAARRSDPETSHLAAEVITKNGTRHHQQQLAADAVRKHPGRTSQELAHLTGIDRYVLARRLPECTAVRKGVAVECTVTRRQALTWWPV